eukprot:3672669-Karenia_brevis.AAC.1
MRGLRIMIGTPALAPVPVPGPVIWAPGLSPPQPPRLGFRSMNLTMHHQYSVMRFMNGLMVPALVS